MLLSILLSLGFIEVPFPPVLIVTLMERHTYTCSHSEAAVLWRVNGRLFNRPPNIVTTSQSLPGGEILYMLTVGGFSEHNGTTIQCEAIRDDGAVIEQSPIVTFYSQG